MKALFARLSAPRLSRPKLSMREPTRCPFHPDLPPHWNKHGSYKRKDPGCPADDPGEIYVTRCKCKIAVRTFSVSPDAIPPHQQQTTEAILRRLHCMIVEGHGSAKASQLLGAPRTTLRRIRAKFHATVNILRLAGHAGALDAASFLRRLFAMSVDAIADLFAEWKEREPKLSLVGIYPR